MRIACQIAAVIIAIVLHEAAHGVTAYALGDDTAKLAGRFSLNPLRHIDRFGTIVLPGFLVVSQLIASGHVSFMFGWAKPVPVNAGRFRYPRQQMAVVAIAGPLSNFCLAWVAALMLPQHWLELPLTVATEFWSSFLLYNLLFGLFNLLPIPPLDGGRIMVGILPAALAFRWARLERAGLLVVLLAVFLLPSLLSQFGVTFDPISWALDFLMPRIGRPILWLAGHDV